MIKVIIICCLAIIFAVCAQPPVDLSSIVGQDSSDNFSTMATAPERSRKRDTILVKAGIYDEIVCVKRLTWNLTLVGDGVGMTVITGNRSADDGFITHEMEFSSTRSAESQFCTVTSNVCLGNTFSETYLSRSEKIYSVVEGLRPLLCGDASPSG
uniref:Pectinesterase catalytic domain-containing protein n=1 Tax=Leersia perrieri TaxID=77586 RepID=A0A0D9VWK7_9ORYZ